MNQTLVNNNPRLHGSRGYFAGSWHHFALKREIHKNPVAVACGHGKPSSARVRKAMGGRIASGSPHIHDLERAHGVLVREGGLDSEAHRADVNDPVYLERMEMLNDLCSWLKRHL